MDRSRHRADPTINRPFEGRFPLFAVSQGPHAPAASVDANFDRNEIAVVLQAVFGWGGDRWTRALDAMVPAKRGRK